MDHPRPGLKYVDAKDLDKKTFDFSEVEVDDPAGEKLGRVDGFIIDVAEARPYHVVVEAGHWFKHKRFLLPIGYVALDTTSRRMIAEVPKARAERFPGFNRGEFERFTDADIDRMAESSAAACSSAPLDTSTMWYSWSLYEYPHWWDASQYRPDRADTAARNVAGATSAGTAGTASAAPTPTASTRERDRDLVTARGGEMSPHDAGRAQPGDVIGVETGGEQTHIGDTADDENTRRRDAETSGTKSRD
jgi:PRC-barrel domain protein